MRQQIMADEMPVKYLLTGDSKLLDIFRALLQLTELAVFPTGDRRTPGCSDTSEPAIIHKREGLAARSARKKEGVLPLIINPEGICRSS